MATFIAATTPSRTTFMHHKGRVSPINKKEPVVSWTYRISWALTFIFAFAGTFLVHIYHSDKALLAYTAQTVEGGRLLSPEDRFERFVHFAYQTLRLPQTIEDLPSGPVRWYYRLNPLHPGPGDVLRWGCDYRGGCGSHTRVVVAMLRATGVQCHPLMLLDHCGQSLHTVVEARIWDRWVVADALYDIVFRKRDGQLASVEDLRKDPALFHMHVDHIPDYDTQSYWYDSVTRFNWHKVPVVLPAVRKLLSMAFGEARVSRWVQPAILMWPQEFYALMCFFLSMILAVITLHRGRRMRITTEAG